MDTLSIIVPINVDISNSNHNNYEDKNQEAVKHPNFKYTYDSSRDHIFRYNLLNDKNLEILSQTLLNKTEIDSEEVDNTITKLNNIILCAARKSFHVTKISRRQNAKKWFNGECVKYRRILRNYSRELSRNPFDREKLALFSKARMAYKKICKKSEKQYRYFLTDKLTDIGLRDPKQFWAIIKKMNNWGNEPTDQTEHIQPNDWIKYFKKLLTCGNEGMDSGVIPLGTSRDGVGPNGTADYDTFEPVLDSRITLEELPESLSDIKLGKATGPDGLPVEYIKIFGSACETALIKLVRLLFSNHLYPSNWTSNFLKPIYKKGDVKNPNNYRGIDRFGFCKIVQPNITETFS